MSLTGVNKKEALKELLILSLVEGVGITRLYQLVNAFGSVQQVLDASISELSNIAGIGRKTASEIKEKQDEKAASDITDRIENLGWSYFLFDEQDYPQPLKTISDRPPILFYRGDYQPCDHNAIAIVGSRVASDEGLRFAENLAIALVENDITVVSGMAYGIDSAAHRGALKANGRTLAIFGTSLEIIYPRRGHEMAEKIANSGGLFSEFLPGTEPIGPNFPRRNRIISGLAQGIVVIEAAEKSGALLTANRALAQNREVFAVPGSPHKPNSRGTNMLIKQGAKLVTSVDDIYDELPRLKGNVKAKKMVKIADLTQSERKIIDLFIDTPIHLDDLSRKLSIPVPDLMQILLALELKGIVKELSGKRFFLN